MSSLGIYSRAGKAVGVRAPGRVHLSAICPHQLQCKMSFDEVQSNLGYTNSLLSHIYSSPKNSAIIIVMVNELANE